MYRQFYLLYAFLLFYGSLLPFDFQLQDFAAVQAEFRSRSLLSWRLLRSGEVLANYLLYVPLGFLLGIRFVRQASAFWRFLFALLFASVLSFGAEVAQAFLVSRYASLLDVFLNLSGACLGVSLADVFSAQLNKYRLRLFVPLARLRRRSLDPLWSWSTLLCTFLYALLLSLLFLPRFELMLAGNDNVATFDRIRDFFQIPFLDFQSVDYGSVLKNAALKVALFLPMGAMLGTYIALKNRSARQRRRALLLLLPCIVSAVLAIEIAQLLSSGHTASISDSCLYMFGLIGGWSLSSAIRVQSIGVSKVERNSAALAVRQRFAA